MGNELNGNDLNGHSEKKDRSAIKTVIATALGTVGGFEATAANLEMEEKALESFEYHGGDVTDETSGITVYAHEAQQDEYGEVQNLAYAHDDEGHCITLVDTNNDGVVDLQAADMNYDGTFTNEEIMNVSGMGISIENPDTEQLASNLEIFDQDKDMPDYYNEADVSGIL